jgi:hypothetical protein
MTDFDRGNTRRCILLSTTTLAAVAAFGSGIPARVAKVSLRDEPSVKCRYLP